jgi:hypothetical protein
MREDYGKGAIIDKGKATLVVKTEDCLTFEFSGKTLRGHWILRAVPGKKISWVFQRLTDSVKA